MNPETRPNITVVGAVTGGLSSVTIAPVIVWIWNGWLVPKGAPAMDAVVGSAIGGMVVMGLTSLAQRWDRASKRTHQHVIRKHGAEYYGPAGNERSPADDTA